MFSFLKSRQPQKEDQKYTFLNCIYEKLKRHYKYEQISEDRKNYLKNEIEKYGYLAYPYVKALEELSPAEILFGLEVKWKLNNVFENNCFSFKDISPVSRANIHNSDWIKSEQHNIKLINLAGLGDGNNTQEPGKFIDWLRQVLILPAGLPEKGVLSTTIYLIPFHPREFGCAYLPTSTEVSPNLEDESLSSEMGLDAKSQVQLFVQMAQLAGHPVIYDILPQTGRFSKMVLSNPKIARWYDINYLSAQIEESIEEASKELFGEFDEEDIEIVKKLYKDSLKSGSGDLSEFYQPIYDRFSELLSAKKKEFSDKMMTKAEQDKLHKHVKEIVASIHDQKPNKISKEEDITKQGQTIQTLIGKGFWPAPGGAWCSAGVPVFDRMSTCGAYPVFKHFDFEGNDVSHFANLDCQTPFYFVCLESGKFNNDVVNFYINQQIKLQKDYNFDGFRVDHIDHIVDPISEQNGVPISYRAPRVVLDKCNRALKEKVAHFACLAEYMLWDRFYKQYHQDMNFDILWGNDIISQFEKTPLQIIKDNQELSEYNEKNHKLSGLSILKIYNNQDGEFRAIDQYPGQLGENGAIFKWFKYKFLPCGKNAQRPVMFVDGDESFTKVGIESTIGAEISMEREKNYEFFRKFDAINRFALQNELARQGEAEIIVQGDDGFVAWMISKDPLKETLLVVANYFAPTEKINTQDEDGMPQSTIQEAEAVFDKSLELPCDYKIVSEFVLKDNDFVENVLDLSCNKLSFEKLEPSEFKVYKLIR